MPQYVVIAYDGSDPEASARRQAARPAHMEGVKPMAERGELIVGGAILNDAGAMIGSVAIVEFADQAGLDRWLATDPYVTGKVWQKIEVKPFRVAITANK
jgi:uncharacterized protein YciI